MPCEIVSNRKNYQLFDSYLAFCYGTWNRGDEPGHLANFIKCNVPHLA
jgi:hypothetical protein